MGLFVEARNITHFDQLKSNGIYNKICVCFTKSDLITHGREILLFQTEEECIHKYEYIKNSINKYKKWKQEFNKSRETENDSSCVIC